MVVDPKGEYVDYDDYAAIESALLKEGNVRRALKQAIVIGGGVPADEVDALIEAARNPGKGKP